MMLCLAVQRAQIPGLCFEPGEEGGPSLRGFDSEVWLSWDPADLPEDNFSPGKTEVLLPIPTIQRGSCGYGIYLGGGGVLPLSHPASHLWT